MTFEELKFRAANWARRQEAHREAECQASQRLMERVLKTLQDPRLYCDPFRAMKGAEIASRLGRLACNMPLEPQPKKEPWQNMYSFDVEAMLKRAYGPHDEPKPPTPADQTEKGLQPPIDL